MQCNFVVITNTRIQAKIVTLAMIRQKDDYEIENTQLSKRILPRWKVLKLLSVANNIEDSKKINANFYKETFNTL